MKINIQAVGITTFTPLEEHIQKKVGKLETFYDSILSCKVFLKKENGSDKENKTTEIILGVPGDDIVVKKTAVSFEESVDLCVETAKKLLLKKKENDSEKQNKAIADIETTPELDLEEELFD